MRRILLWGASTVSALVLLFGYHTSTSSALAGGTGQTPFTGSASGTTGGGSDRTASGSAGSSGPGSNGGGSGNGGSGNGGSGNGGGNGGSGSGGSANGAGKAPTTTKVTGDVAPTQWGPVQVQLTLDGGRITQVSVLQYPSGNPTDGQINSYALPILIKETTQTQSAHIDMVSGATVTSTGYLQSLQSALDRAGA